MTEFTISVDYEDIQNETITEMGFGLFITYELSLWYISIILLLTLTFVVVIIILIYRCVQISRINRDISETSYYQNLTPPSPAKSFEIMSSINDQSGKIQWYQNRLIRIKESQFCKKCHLPITAGNCNDQNRYLISPKLVRKCEKVRPISQPSATNLPRFDNCTNYSIFEQYGSANLLDDYYKYETEEYNESSVITAVVKSRSLPSSVRHKSRPLSTEEDLLHFYAEVNFSKKRKNRMRNDDAAIIALSKSRSEFSYQETDSLVNNEAVLVYDERTAL